MPISAKEQETYTLQDFLEEHHYLLWFFIINTIPYFK